MRGHLPAAAQLAAADGTVETSDPKRRKPRNVDRITCKLAHTHLGQVDVGVCFCRVSSNTATQSARGPSTS